MTTKRSSYDNVRWNKKKLGIERCHSTIYHYSVLKDTLRLSLIISKQSTPQSTTVDDVIELFRCFHHLDPGFSQRVVAREEAAPDRAILALVRVWHSVFLRPVVLALILLCRAMGGSGLGIFWLLQSQAGSKASLNKLSGCRRVIFPPCNF